MSVILSIFCLSCRKPYGNILILIAWIHLNITDEVSRRPRLGSCFHIICEECQNKRNDDTCQVCGKENAFVGNIQNYGLVGMWEDIVKSMSAEQYFENHVTKPKVSYTKSCYNYLFGSFRKSLMTDVQHRTVQGKLCDSVQHVQWHADWGNRIRMDHLVFLK